MSSEALPLGRGKAVYLQYALNLMANLPRRQHNSWRYELVSRSTTEPIVNMNLAVIESELEISVRLVIRY